MQPVIFPISSELIAAAQAALTTAVSTCEPDPCPTCTDLRAKLQSSAMDCLAIDGQAMDLLTENKRLRTALTAISRATTLIQAAQIAEGALRGDVGTATTDVV
jgi:hypothetical protein